MKALKFNHQLATLIREGKKTSTWRMFDDKDLSVDDVVQLIDKADPSNSATWQKFATARINSIIQKRLSDAISEEGADEQSGDAKTVLQRYKLYYGPHISLDTPVKIIYFTLLEQKNAEKNAVLETTKTKEIKLFADGGSRGNPGPSASGYAIFTMDDRIIAKRGLYLGVTTNNQAEYQALKFGLEEARRMRVQTVHVYMDSLLVINQMLGIFKVSNRDLWPIHDIIRKLAQEFKKVTFTHVPRALNKIADAAVNEALDEADQSQTR